MLELVAMRGAPGSGKTFIAKRMAKEHSMVRVSRDDLRMALFNKEFGVNEKLISDVHVAAIRAALRHGYSVVVDNVHAKIGHFYALQGIAREFKASFRVVEMNTSLELCLERNLERERYVPEHVIISMWNRIQESPLHEEWT